MNLELLKKLVKLANNNTNDNEANSAARRACRLIEESKFDFKEDPKQLNVRFNPDVFNSIFDELFKNSGMPFKNKNYSAVGVDDDGTVRVKTPPRYKTHNAEPPTPKYETIFEDAVYPKWWHYINRGTNPKSSKPKIKKKCSKCGNIKDTIFVGPEALFICQDCTWEPYNTGVKG